VRILLTETLDVYTLSVTKYAYQDLITLIAECIGALSANQYTLRIGMCVCVGGGGGGGVWVCVCVYMCVKVF